jgi:hypothetical protein
MILFLSLGFVTAESYNVTYDNYNDIDGASLQIEALKYDPYPVNPGEYFTLWISVYKTGTGTKGATFELEPTYPFSLDSNEDAVREYGSISSQSVLLEYKIRVSDDAVEGENQIYFNYKLTGSNSWIQKKFDIYVSDAQTSFDGVIQDMEEGTLSLALANVGKNVANSVIVRIPQQDGFKSTGVSGQMVGNLENGDYTIVSFEVSQIDRNADSITFQIDYTDAIGERRTIYLEQSVSSGQTINNTSLGLEARTIQNGTFGPSGIQKQKSYTWLYAIGIIVLIIGGYFLWIKYSKRKKEFMIKKLSEQKKDKKN